MPLLLNLDVPIAANIPGRQWQARLPDRDKLLLRAERPTSRGRISTWWTLGGHAGGELATSGRRLCRTHFTDKQALSSHEWSLNLAPRGKVKFFLDQPFHEVRVIAVPS